MPEFMRLAWDLWLSSGIGSIIMLLCYPSMRASFALITLALTGCSVQPPAYLAAPAEPSRSKPIETQSLTKDARDWPEVVTGNWGDLNRQIAPKGAGR